MSLNTATLLPSGNIALPKGRMLYPALFKPAMPRGETDEKKAKYQISVLIPKGSNIDVLKAAYEEAIAEKVTAKMRATTKIKSPFLKTADQPRFTEFADEFPLMIRCNATMRPDVVTPNAKGLVKEEDEADEVYSGRWCRVSIRPFFYDHPTGGKGVSFGLQNVQLLDHDEAIAGGKVKGLNEFEAVSSDALADLEEEIPF